MTVSRVLARSPSVGTTGPGHHPGLVRLSFSEHGHDDSCIPPVNSVVLMSTAVAKGLLQCEAPVVRLFLWLLVSSGYFALVV